MICQLPYLDVGVHGRKKRKWMVFFFFFFFEDIKSYSRFALTNHIDEIIQSSCDLHDSNWEQYVDIFFHLERGQVDMLPLFGNHIANELQPYNNYSVTIVSRLILIPLTQLVTPLDCTRTSAKLRMMYWVRQFYSCWCCRQLSSLVLLTSTFCGLDQIGAMTWRTNTSFKL